MRPLALTSRGRKAKGCDLFLSMHSNAAGAESVDYPVAYVPLNGTGTDIGQKLADIVADVMGTVQNGRTATRRGGTGADYYGVIRGAVSVGVPGVILEHSFHTNPKAAAWLMSDANLSKLAKAEADCIAAWLEGTVKPAAQTLQVAKSKSAAYNKAYKTTADLNMRSGAGTDFPVLTTLPHGAAFRCYGFYNVVGSTVWLFGDAAGKKGYCSKSYLL